MTTRDRRFLSDYPGLRGTITRFAIVRHELLYDKRAIAITIAIDWVLTERPATAEALSTTWRVSIFGRRSDGSDQLLAVANSSAGIVRYQAGTVGDEHRFELIMTLELPADDSIPVIEATIRREEDLLRSPLGEVLGYVAGPDVDPAVEQMSPAVSRWLHRDLDSLGILFDAPSHEPAPYAHLIEARFAVYASSRVERGRQFIIEIWAFRSQLETQVEQEATRGGRQLLGSKGPVPIAVGKTLTVSVTIPSFDVDPAVDAVAWDGNKANTSFVVRAPDDAALGSYIGSASVQSGGIPVAVVRFELVVAEQGTDTRRSLSNEQTRIRSIFASYASDDRVDVLQWARGAAVAGVDVFLDVLTLREGSDWEKELFRYVPSRDLFCLFWSAPARRSKWVEMEWRCALAARGLDYIHPVPLADPRIVPPPEELHSRHFSGTWFILREYEKRMRGATTN
jgi:hypothetical protein